MQVCISDVGNVIAFTLQETEHIDFVGEELPCPSAVIVWTVERDLGRGNPSRAVIGIKRLAAPGVVGLIGINAAQKHVSGSARVIAHYENDSGLIAAGEAGEFGNINTTSPVGWVIGIVRHIQDVRVNPVTLEQRSGGIDDRARSLQSAT